MGLHYLALLLQSVFFTYAGDVSLLVTSISKVSEINGKYNGVSGNKINSEKLVYLRLVCGPLSWIDDL